MKFKSILLIFPFFFFSCDKDPISGLERGWIWGGKQEDEATLTIHGKNRYTLLVKLYEGSTTDENNIIENFRLEPSEIKEFVINTKEDYTIYYGSNFYNCTSSDNININKSCTLEVADCSHSGC